MNTLPDLYSCYYNLASDYVSDARIHTDILTTDNIIRGLSQLPSTVKKYVTINGRFTPYQQYDSEHLRKLTTELKRLYDAGCLDGLLYLDYYFLQLLGATDPVFYKLIEAVPSINCFIDSIDKLNSHMMYLHDAGFKAPSKMIIDRTVNRKMEDFQQFVRKSKKTYPLLQIEMLVNEGCLYNCPYKVNHDVAISLLNDQSTTGKVYMLQKQKETDFDISRLNEEHGCINYLSTHVSRFFATPFVRPEDIHHYDGMADIIKISGRIKPDEFVYNAYGAYNDGIWEGNLLDIIDAAGPLSDDFFIHNDQIPSTFHKMLTTCDQNCLQCNYCEKVVEKSVQFFKKS
jgi:hypothetical protein